MFIRKIVFLFFLSVFYCLHSFAENNDFYDALITIMHDAPNGFKNIKGKTVSNSYFAIVWDCGIKIPGTVASRFVYSKGIFYEGAILQTQNINDIKPIYDHYISLLDSCLKPLGYSKTFIDNFYPGIEGYKKVAFLQDIKPGTPVEKIPPHLALEVTHSKEKELFTIVLYIYEH